FSPDTLFNLSGTSVQFERTHCSDQVGIYILGFLDETAPQTTVNTQRLWYFKKHRLIKNTSKFRANKFGIYSPNGNSTITFREHSKKEDVCEVLGEFLDANPGKRIVLVLDNFLSHRSQMVREYSSQKIFI
ncbi:MAG: transposase, partial [Methanospirillaceae archaeon]|nr:transposase [Methanospirillaceae archaeon]